MKAIVPETDKELAVTALLRKQIVGSVYPPGSRLPTRQELMRSLGVSITTVQRAMEQLGREGFVCPRGAAGNTPLMSPGRGAWVMRALRLSMFTIGQPQT